MYSIQLCRKAKDHSSCPRHILGTSWSVSRHRAVEEMKDNNVSAALIGPGQDSQAPQQVGSAKHEMIDNRFTREGGCRNKYPCLALIGEFEQFSSVFL